MALEDHQRPRQFAAIVVTDQQSLMNKAESLKKTTRDLAENSKYRRT
jgi:hypothetical protein